MDKQKITGSEALMLALKAEGVKTIFGYPGGSIMPVYDALYDYTLILYQDLLNITLLALVLTSKNDNCIAFLNM